MKKLNTKIATIILAAGQGVRMKSKVSKVLHPLAGKPMILASINNFKLIDPSQIILVASPNNKKELKKIAGSNVTIAIQTKPKGTADATNIGLQKVTRAVDTVIVANGDDSAFYKGETIKRVINKHINTKSVQTILTVRLHNPEGFGRVVKKKGKVTKIIEEKEATQNQKKIKEINAGLYVFDKNWLKANLSKIKQSSTTREKYLVDLVDIAIKQNKKVSTCILKDTHEWHGINTQEELKKAEEKFRKRIHVMGMAGAGASAISGIAKSYGYDVSGCDLSPGSSYVKNLKQKIIKGHHKSHIHNIGMLIISPAIIKNDPKNPELLQAKKQNIPILTWQEFQGKHLQDKKFVISVAGAYGKSTTTAMISQIMKDANVDPTCEIGATVRQWQRNYLVGKSKYYINEADEYNDNFLNYNPDIAVILNVAWDHPDYFKSKSDLISSYQKFIGNIKKNGYLVIGEDKALGKLAKSVRNDIKVVKVQEFDDVSLEIIGKFRKTNANTALTVAKILKLDIEKAKKTVQKFKGVGRRLEFKGEIKWVKVYDDYAVQPYTIMSTANALREKFPDKKIILVLEPHTFSRTRVFFDEFVASLKHTKVNKIFVTKVYLARESGDKYKLSRKLAQAVGPKAIFSGSVKNTSDIIKTRLKNFDVICSMGAGDVYKLYDLLQS